MAAGRITLRDFHVLTRSEDDCRQWLRANRLLPVAMMCPKCHHGMEERIYNRVSDGLIWRCPPKQCRATVSIRRGSFFEKSHLPLTKLCDLLYYWSMDLNNVETQYQVYVSSFRNSSQVLMELSEFITNC